jgi:hypothetical protein
MFTPVMNFASSLAKKSAAFATSLGSVNRPYGFLCQFATHDILESKPRNKMKRWIKTYQWHVVNELLSVLWGIFQS